MRRLRAVALGVYDFVVGEDWLLAVGVLLVLLLGWAASTMTGSKVGMITLVEPVISPALKKTMPAMCDIGAACSATLPSPAMRSATADSAFE